MLAGILYERRHTYEISEFGGLAASMPVYAAFFLFVVLMHGPGWVQDPRNRFALAVALRETSFSGGALALAVSLTERWRERGRAGPARETSRRTQ